MVREKIKLPSDSLSFQPEDYQYSEVDKNPLSLNFCEAEWVNADKHSRRISIIIYIAPLSLSHPFRLWFQA